MGDDGGALCSADQDAGTARVALWVTALLCLAYLPVLFGQIIFFRDPAHWNYPARFFVRASLLGGESPLWNPEQGLGFSVVANPLYGLFYPPNWLFLLTPRALVASLLTWQGLAHLIWGSVGMVALGRRLRLPPTAAGIAAVAWGLSGYNTTSWTAGLLLFSSAWLPWVAVGFVTLARRAAAGAPGWWRATAGAAVPLACSLLLGEVFASAIAALFGGGMAALAVHLDDRDRSAAETPSGGGARGRWARIAAGLALAVTLAGGVGAVVVVPARRIAAPTDRAHPLDRATAEGGSLHPLRLVEMATPGSSGYGFGHYDARPWIGDAALDGFPLFYSVYLGATVLALALVALGRQRRLAGWLAAGSALALLISLGRFAPLHRILRVVVRPLAYMRYPEKYMVWMTALVALLAGAGAARLLRAERAGWRRLLAAAAALLILATAAPTLFPAPWAPHVVTGGLAGAAAVAAVLLVRWLAGRQSTARLAPALLVALVTGDLAMVAWPFLLFAPRELASDVPAAAQLIVSDHQRRPDALAPPRLYRSTRTDATVRRNLEARSAAADEALSVQTLVENLCATFGVATLPGYDAAIPRLLPDLWVAGQSVGQAVLRLLGIEYAILPIDDARDPVEHRTGITPLMTPLPGARLYRVPDALPRVYLAGRADVLPDQAALARLFDPEVVAGGRVLLAPDAGATALSGPVRRAGGCRLESFRNTRVSAVCRAEREGVAVFLEQHDVGWSATVDGRSVPLLRANLLMRAVRVTPGDHTIVLSYRPPGLAAGAMMSVLALLALTLVALPVRRRPPARRGL